MSADAIATVTADLRAGRFRLIADPDYPSAFPERAAREIRDPTVVDCTALYRSLVAKDEPVYIYEDHPCVAPPFTEAAYCYANEHGNVVVMHTTLLDVATSHWETAEAIDWGDVRWALCATVWVGGRSEAGGGAVPTVGPAHAWFIAVGQHGEPLDIRWVQLMPKYPMERWDMAQLVLLGALNFLNCTNVGLVEPYRPRAERRRIARTGETVHEIAVRATARRSSSTGAETDEASTPLTSVRGHFSHYGDCCPGAHEPRGLLFGKLSGRYWIPQHARGSAEHGTTETSYRLEVDA